MDFQVYNNSVGYEQNNKMSLFLILIGSDYFNE